MTTDMTEIDHQSEAFSEVDASPAKRFFVDMLTRDIELSDAILDLLDNCVDGAMRSKPKADSPIDKPYEGYYAELTFSREKFSIKDNCGGIPHELARKYALRLGRPDPERDSDLPTVGVYGIGMERAIFKIGNEALIYSNSPEGAFEIPITPDWLDNDRDWKLKMIKAEARVDLGTEITVSGIREGIAASFDSDADNFEERFIGTLVKHYSYIIEKGFRVLVNETVIEPKIPRVLLDRSAIERAHGILPYLYETSIDDVRISLIMGMYQKLPTEQDVEEGLAGRRNKNDAGWTIICNDRIVLDNDKTHATGWGEAGVPHYHSQFIAISGVVFFSAHDAKKLPVKTTKRGIDLDSALYSMIKEQMREALKTFTSFTNKWKSDTVERVAIQSNAESIDVRHVSSVIPREKWKPVLKGAKGFRFVPELPTGSEKRSTSRIVYIKSNSEIEIVRNYLGVDEDASPSDVGRLAFESVLAEAAE